MRLIDLDEFLRETCISRIEGESCEDCNFRTLEVSCEELLAQPTIDPVKHGRWIDATKEIGWPEVRCSLCKKIGRGDYAVCPWCGARMDEVEKDE